MNTELFTFINDALVEFDQSVVKYQKYIKYKDLVIDNNELIIKQGDNIQLEYELLGLYNSNQIWIWGWLLPDRDKNEINLSRRLLNYGLNIQPSSNTQQQLKVINLYLKTTLINSRFLIKSEYQLDLILAVSQKLLKNNVLFLLPYKLNINDKESITVYYIVKKITEE